MNHANANLSTCASSTSVRISPSQSPTNTVIDGDHVSSVPPTALMTRYATLEDFEFTLSYTDTNGDISLVELSEKLSSHLLFYLRKALPDDGHIVDVELGVVELSNTPRFQGSSKFHSSGQAIFYGASLPSIEDLNELTVDAFVGDGHDDFLSSLSNSSDSTLRSTTASSFSFKKTNHPVLSSSEAFLTTEHDDASANGSTFLWIGLISIGVILTVIFVLMQRRACEAEVRNNYQFFFCGTL